MPSITLTAEDGGVTSSSGGDTVELGYSPSIDTTLNNTSSFSVTGNETYDICGAIYINSLIFRTTYNNLSDVRLVITINSFDYTCLMNITTQEEGYRYYLAYNDASGGQATLGTILDDKNLKNTYCPLFRINKVEILATKNLPGGGYIPDVVLFSNAITPGVYSPIFLGGINGIFRTHACEALPGAPITFKDQANATSKVFAITYGIEQIYMNNTSQVSISNVSVSGGADAFSIVASSGATLLLETTVWSPSINDYVTFNTPFTETTTGIYKLGNTNLSVITDPNSAGPCYVTSIKVFMDAIEVARSYIYTSYTSATGNAGINTFSFFWDSFSGDSGKVYFSFELTPGATPADRRVRILGCDPIYMNSSLVPGGVDINLDIVVDESGTSTPITFPNVYTDMAGGTSAYGFPATGLPITAYFTTEYSYITPTITSVIINTYNSSGPVTIDYFNYTGSLACLLEGTRLSCVDGSIIAIENVSRDDIVMTTAGPKRVLEVGHWVVPWEAKTHMNNKAIFRVDAGTLGATTPVYLSYWHQVRCADGVMRPAAASRLPRATKEEICAPASSVYHLYHIAVEDYQTSHLLVNGGCVVESWCGSDTVKVAKPKIEGVRPIQQIASF